MSNKAHMTATTIHEQLRARFSNTTMAPGDVGVSEGLATISCGAAGATRAFIRVAPVPSLLPQNRIGLPNDNELAPIVCQLVTEAGARALGPAEILPLLLILTRANVRIEWYESATGTGPSAATITGSPAAWAQ